LGRWVALTFIVVIGELGRRLVVMKTVVAEEMRAPDLGEMDLHGEEWLPRLPSQVRPEGDGVLQRPPVILQMRALRPLRPAE
jgi:hypothetical protein